MNVALVQMDVVWARKEVNLQRAEELIRQNPGAEVYVLPEMFTTGVSMQPEKVADPLDGPTVQWMRRMAATTDAAIVGSLPVKEADGTYRNRMYFVEPDGKTTVYDKRHFFSYSGENRHYKAGDERVIVTFRGVRFLLQVCYDLRYPVWTRTLDDYDVVLYCANWPIQRRSAWEVLLRARAMENQACVIGVNRVGNDPVCSYFGGSLGINFFGDVVVSCTDYAEMVMMYPVNMDELQHYRSKFPVLDGAERFQLLEGRFDYRPDKK